MKPIARWTIGPTNSSGLEALCLSILSFKKIYDVDIVLCFNGYDFDTKKDGIFKVINQKKLPITQIIDPKGVAWKLLPPRIDINRHEIFIDNDLIVEKQIPGIDLFFRSKKPLLLESESTNYGRYSKYIQSNHIINSGLFGLPPGFDFERCILNNGNHWENNSIDIKKNHLSYTFDEQGLVTYSLIDKDPIIISKHDITTCDLTYLPSKGMHFVGLNRRTWHGPWKEFLSERTKFFF